MEKEKYMSYVYRLKEICRKGMNGIYTDKDVMRELFLLGEECSPLAKYESVLHEVMNVCDSQRRKIAELHDAYKDICARIYYVLDMDSQNAKKYTQKIEEYEAQNIVDDFLKTSF